MKCQFAEFNLGRLCFIFCEVGLQPYAKSLSAFCVCPSLLYLNKTHFDYITCCVNIHGTDILQKDRPDTHYLIPNTSETLILETKYLGLLLERHVIAYIKKLLYYNIFLVTHRKTF